MSKPSIRWVENILDRDGTTTLYDVSDKETFRCPRGNSSMRELRTGRWSDFDNDESGEQGDGPILIQIYQSINC